MLLQGLFALILCFCIHLSTCRTITWPKLSSSKCSEGYILHIDGQCAKPIIRRRIYLFDLPRNQYRTMTQPKIQTIYQQPKPQSSYWKSPYGVNTRTIHIRKMPHNNNSWESNYRRVVTVPKRDSVLYSISGNRLIPLKATNILVNTDNIQKQIDWQNSITRVIHHLVQNKE